jgi:hypothetical protein
MTGITHHNRKGKTLWPNGKEDARSVTKWSIRV